MIIKLQTVLHCIKRRFCSQSRPEMVRVLNVAEKNDAAKSLADIMSGGRYQKREGFSKFNKIYEYNLNIFGQNSKMVMTSVSGHLLNYEFTSQYKYWQSCAPVALFDAPVQKQCDERNVNILRTLEKEGKAAKILIIWTDCDREGENIGFEVIQVCTSVNANLKIYRAKFSEITRGAVDRAISNLTQPDRNTSDAVDVRQELDLRIGAAFTRFQTLRLKKVFPEQLADQLISYGSCQFPTLGFVVERFKQVQAFVPEPFWKIRVMHETTDGVCEFRWGRNRLFDHGACEALYKQVVENPVAKVVDVKSKPKTKWRPAALETVELEKLASRKLRISAKETMKIAEKLYTQGYISYPRTETNQFPKDFDLRTLIEHQAADPNWGAFASDLLQVGPTPKNGNKTDKAHPPIHPTKYTNSLQGNEARLYEFIVRHFLACCSQNAQGQETTVEIDLNGEKFEAAGLMIIARNYLEVYPYDKWNAKVIPKYLVGEEFEPNTVSMEDGKTSPPSLLTEADLISLMDKHGIGTDATHAEHIETIKSRLYVGLTPDGKFVPGELGMGLVEGYDAMGFALSKPNLRAAQEADLKRICEGTRDKDDVLNEHIARYKEVFIEASRQANKLDEALSVHFGQGQAIAESESSGAWLPVFKCTQCESDMIVKQKKDGKGFFISCMGYPDCKNAIWLPDFVMDAKVEDSICEKCAPGKTVNRITFKFKRTPSLPPQYQTMHTGCIGGCDAELNDALSIRFTSPRRPTANQNTKQNQRTRIQNNSLSDSGIGSSINSTNSIQNRDYHTQSQNASIQHRAYHTQTQNAFNNSGPGILRPTPPMSNAPRPRQPLGVINNAMTNEGDRNVMCNCGTEAPLLTVRKEGPNCGRQFYGCSKGVAGSCGFFLWADQPAEQQTRHSFPSQSQSMPTTNNRLSSPVRWQSNSSDNDTGGNEVCCNCDQSAKLLTVRKDGPNCGRQFYGCIKGQSESCGFFLWADQDGANDRMPSTQPSNSYNRSSTFGGGLSQAGGWGDNSSDMNCGCGQPAKQLTVSKEGPNNGRQFYACPKGKGQGCNFFKWCDESEGSSTTAFQSGRGRGAKAPRVSSASGKQRKCGFCKEEGHDKRNCPNR